MTQLPTVETPREPVTTSYHGVEVTEDYRWLEDGTSDRTRAWTSQQDARTRAWLHAIPFREAVRRRVEEILKVESSEYDHLARGGATYFALRTQPPKQQPFLVALSRVEVPA